MWFDIPLPHPTNTYTKMHLIILYYWNNNKHNLIPVTPLSLPPLAFDRIDNDGLDLLSMLLQVTTVARTCVE